jgi:hypothetical protein
MEYQINVALDGKHFCRVSVGEIELDAKIKATEFSKRFPKSEGFKITLMLWKTSGYSVEF